MSFNTVNQTKAEEREERISFRDEDKGSHEEDRGCGGLDR